MADLVFVLLVLAFFALCALYVRGVERIVRSTDGAVETPSEVTR